MNTQFMKALKALEVQVNAINEALPSLREAGESLSADELVTEIRSIKERYGLGDVL